MVVTSNREKVAKFTGSLYCKEEKHLVKEKEQMWWEREGAWHPLTRIEVIGRRER